jgi:hypothetical protein
MLNAWAGTRLGIRFRTARATKDRYFIAFSFVSSRRKAGFDAPDGALGMDLGQYPDGAALCPSGSEILTGT